MVKTNNKNVMNRISKLIAMLALFLVYACTPDEYSLSTPDVTPSQLVEGIAFKIVHDTDNPNIVYLHSLMGGAYTPVWDHPQGRSQQQDVELKIPFAGTYSVKFGVETRGGVVYGDPVTFTVDDLYAGFISDPMWTLLSGGADKEKTWYLDLDATAISRNFLGPLYFYGTNNGWQGNCELEGGDCWNYNPDYKGNTWLMSPADFGSMTFDLKGGAHVTVTHNTISSRGTEAGSYMIDVNNHTMRMNDASPLHDSNRDGVVVDWGNIKIFSLTENTMQLAVIRDPALSGEGACLLVYNFVSKDYFDNWVPGEAPEPEPPYNGQDPNGDLTTTTNTSKTWALSLATPYNWAGLAGNFLNNITSAADYATIGWTPYDADNIANISLTLDKTGDNAGSYVFTDADANEITGTYSVDADNNIVFDQSISFVIADWVSLQTGDGNKLRIISTEKDAFGNITKLWLGKRDPTKDEYMVYGFEPTASGGGGGSEGTQLTFDNSKLAFGNLEGNGNLRLELYNDFGSTKANPPIDPATVVFGSRISVTFTLGGITLKGGAAGSYKTKFGFADPDWDPQHFGDGTDAGEATVTGNGTYTAWYEPSTTANGALVFVIDIAGLAADIDDLSTVTATIDKVVVR
jgi:hypothetical protein